SLALIPYLHAHRLWELRVKSINFDPGTIGLILLMMGIRSLDVHIKFVVGDLSKAAPKSTRFRCKVKGFPPHVARE
ncbi:hypothetical protein HAX54_051226, partial [Datura stramonium]|nr:hypothetical protein [Datura stramonium]